AEEVYDRIQKKIESGQKLTIVDQKNFDFAKRKLEEFEILTNDVETAKMTFQNATMEMINTTIALDERTSQAIGSVINDFSLFVATSEESGERINSVFSSLLTDLETDTSFKAMLNNYSVALDELKRKTDEGLPSDELDKYRVKVETTFDSIKNKLIEY